MFNVRFTFYELDYSKKMNIENQIQFIINLETICKLSNNISHVT